MWMPGSNRIACTTPHHAHLDRSGLFTDPDFPRSPLASALAQNRSLLRLCAAHDPEMEGARSLVAPRRRAPLHVGELPARSRGQDRDDPHRRRVPRARREDPGARVTVTSPDTYRSVTLSR